MGNGTSVLDGNETLTADGNGRSIAGTSIADNSKIYEAVNTGDIKTVTQLIRSDPQIIDRQIDEEGSSALMEAVANCPVETVTALIKNRANVNHQSNNGKKALDLSKTAAVRELFSVDKDKTIKSVPAPAAAAKVSAPATAVTSKVSAPATAVTSKVSAPATAVTKVSAPATAVTSKVSAPASGKVNAMVVRMLNIGFEEGQCLRP
eukprot:gene9760-20296_t